MQKLNKDPNIYYDDCFDEHEALISLLNNNVLFFSCFDYYNKDKKLGATITLHVMCSDIFAWGCADSEDLLYSEIEELYNWWYNDNSWGAIKWCCKKRNMQPQRPVKDIMVRNNVWDDMMQNLPLNPDRDGFNESN